MCDNRHHVPASGKGIPSSAYSSHCRSAWQEPQPPGQRLGQTHSTEYGAGWEVLPLWRVRDGRGTVAGFRRRLLLRRSNSASIRARCRSLRAAGRGVRDLRKLEAGFASSFNTARSQDARDSNVLSSFDRNAIFTGLWGRSFSRSATRPSAIADCPPRSAASVSVQSMTSRCAWLPPN